MPVLDKARIRRTGKRWVKESEYLRYVRLLWSDSRLWLREPGTLPSFLVIGAQRAGSTFLHDHLASCTSAGPSPLQKEVHYFDNKYYRSLRWYSKFFKSLKGGGKKVKKNFETSPYYLYHPAVPKRIAESLPEVKLIVVLREPVDRAVSQYKWMRQIGLETRTAKEAFQWDAERIDLERDSSYLTQFEDPLHFDSDHIYRSYLRRSLYHIQLQRWLEHFQASQIRVLCSKDLFDNTTSLLEALAAFLGVKLSGREKFDSVNQNSSNDDISVSSEARETAERHLKGVLPNVEDILSEEMVVGDALLFQ